MTRNKINISSLTDTDIYKLVLENKLSRFPRYFWEKPGALESAKEITLFLIEKILKWTDKEIKEQLSQNTFFDNKLRGMLSTLFNSSPYAALNNAYPDKFKPWELNVTHFHFWNAETAYEFIKWVIEEKYKWDAEQIKDNFSKTWLVNLGYDEAMDCIKEDTYGIINKLYPNVFRPWELKQVAINYWTQETMGEAIKWLIEEKVKIKDITEEKITVELLESNGLARLVTYIYKKKISLYELINMAYPNKYKPWEVTYNISWTKENKRDAIKWLVEEKLKLDPSKELNKVRAKHFIHYGLSGLLSVFNNSPKEALKETYKK